jgi:hypothetical protein
MMLNRRHFLRAATGSLVLPWLDAFAAGSRPKPKQRMICICAPLGLHPAYFFPEKAGKDYASTLYLDVIGDFREDFTVISGLCHAGNKPGFAHQATASFLTAPRGRTSRFKNEISSTSLGGAHRRRDVLLEPRLSGGAKVCLMRRARRSPVRRPPSSRSSSSPIPGGGPGPTCRLADGRSI